MTIFRSKSSTPTLHFDPDAHTYTVDGVEVDYPSKLMKEAGLVSVSFYKAEHRERGSHVHEAAEALDQGETEVRLSATEQPYLESYLAWRRLVNPVWELIEVPRFSAKYNLAGTADRIGRLGGSAGRQVIVDLKTGPPQNWHGLQMCLYDLVYSTKLCPPLTRDRVAVYLRRDGKCAQSVTYRSFSDYQTATRLLAERDGPKKETTSHAQSRPRRSPRESRTHHQPASRSTPEQKRHRSRQRSR
jgi:hypothetical protein